MRLTPTAEPFREAGANEIARACSLLGVQSLPSARFFVATVPDPVSRIVAAAMCVSSLGADGCGFDVRFDWTVISGRRHGSSRAMFLKQLTDHLRAEGLRSLRALRLIDPRSWEVDAFRAAGFEVIARHEHFRLEGDYCRRRQDRIISRFTGQRSPAFGSSIESINSTNSAAAADLIQRHGLLAADRFWTGLKEGAWQEFSALLMHQGKADGVLLASQSGPEDVSLYVLAACPESATSSGLVCYALFQSLRARCDSLGINRVYFWAEPDRSPATRLIALRFGGQIVGQTLQFGLCL